MTIKSTEATPFTGHTVHVGPTRSGMSIGASADLLSDKLRQNRKVNSGTPVSAKRAAPWYRRFDKR